MDRNEWRVADPPDAGSVFTMHRLGLLRLAVLLIGDRATAEDVVQDAFAGLHSRWAELHDVASALAYVRGSVVNGCRMVLRRRSLMRRIGILGDPPIWSAESAALVDPQPVEGCEVLVLLDDVEHVRVRGRRKVRPRATGCRLLRRGHLAGLDVADGQLIDVVTAKDVGDEVPR